MGEELSAVLVRHIIVLLSIFIVILCSLTLYTLMICEGILEKKSSSILLLPPLQIINFADVFQCFFLISLSLDVRHYVDCL